jgi:hypothetical protein
MSISSSVQRWLQLDISQKLQKKYPEDPQKVVTALSLVAKECEQKQFQQYLKDPIQAKPFQAFHVALQAFKIAATHHMDKQLPALYEQSSRYLENGKHLLLGEEDKAYYEQEKSYLKLLTPEALVQQRHQDKLNPPPAKVNEWIA